MGFFSAIRFPELRYVSRGGLPVRRTPISFPGNICFCRENFEVDSRKNGLFASRVVPPTLLAEKAEAGVILTMFLKNQGLNEADAARTINNSDLLIDHLVSWLYSVFKSRYLVGQELTTSEIRDALTSYLESLLQEYGNSLVDLLENFPNQHVEGKTVAPVFPPTSTLKRRTLNALSKLNVTDPAHLPRNVLYYMELGMKLERIRKIVHKFPAFIDYTVEGKIKPLVEFLLDLGVSISDIPVILNVVPQMCGLSISGNIIPTMAFLESLGVDKNQWAKVIIRGPTLLTYSREKIQLTVDFLYEMGLTSERIGAILTRHPWIVTHSVEKKLRPAAGYFISLGADVSVITHRCPQSLALSIENKLKPVTEFFLENGYSVEEIGTMITRCPSLYGYSLEKNLRPKFDFFMTLDYPKKELLKFPQYFGLSLEGRIKPRYALMKESGVKLRLTQLSLPDPKFEKVLKFKMLKNRNGRP